MGSGSRGEGRGKEGKKSKEKKGTRRKCEDLMRGYEKEKAKKSKG